MYLDHFGLSEPPFRITPNTDFFFGGANRGATLDALLYAITNDEGIVKVSGEVGSGKTMLCRVLMERLPAHVTLIYLANPSLSREDIHFAIADELKLQIAPRARSSAVLKALQDHLIKAFGEGRRIVVLIDEAHAMPADTLEEIRLLSNLESNRNKLLQLVLFGQPELNDVLARADMRQLKDRITHNFLLEPLVREDISSYLEFRMRAAGYKGPSVFSAPAIKAIADTSLGLTRRINILADKALLAAFAADSHQVGKNEVRAAIRDCDFSEAIYRSRTAALWQTAWFKAGLVGTFGSALALAGWWWYAGAAAPVDANRPVPPPPATSPAALAQATVNPPQPAPIASAPPPQESAPPTLIAGSPPPTPPTAENAATMPSVPPVATAAEPTTAPLAAPPPATATDKYLDAGRDWLATASDQRWFLQLRTVEGRRQELVNAYLAQAKRDGLDMSQVRAYFSELSGVPRYGVIYGDFASSAEALEKLAKLPKTIRAGKPYPRQVVKLR